MPKPAEPNRQPPGRRPSRLVRQVAGTVGAVASGLANTLADAAGGVGLIERAPTRGRYDRSIPAEQREKLTRKRLLQAAAKVFTRKGYEAASVADIIEEAGTSRQTYYDHFPNKEAALRALQESSVRLMIPFLKGVIDRAPTAEAKIHAGVRALLTMVAQSGPIAEIALREMGYSPDVQSARDELMLRFCELLREAAESAYKEGLTQIPPDPITIRALVGAIEAVALDYLKTGRARSVMEASPALERLLLRGLT